MSTDNQSIEEPVSVLVNRTATTSPKDAITMEPVPLLNEQSLSTKHRGTSSITATKIFSIALFILLIILIAYILFHGKVTDGKLSRLTDNADFKSNDIKQLLEEINRTLKSIELVLNKQTQKTNIDGA